MVALLLLFEDEFFLMDLDLLEIGAAVVFEEDFERDWERVAFFAINEDGCLFN